MNITCPRCGNSVEVDFYAPCDGCRDELRATLGADGEGADAAGNVAAAIEYEPKMNVTPNAVALKDD